MADLLVIPTVEVFDEWWQPQGQLHGVTEVRTVHRVCDVGSGTLDCPASYHNRDLLERGARVLVSAGGSPRQVGYLSRLGEEGPAAGSVCQPSWTDVLGDVASETAYPNPETETGQGPVEYDRRAGWASSVVLGFLDANVGAGARPERRIPGLVLAPDPLAGLHLTVPVEARWRNLLDLLRTTALPNGLVFDVTMVDRDLVFEVRAVRDLSSTVMFTGGMLTASSWSLKAPTATHVLAMGKGEGVDRLVELVTTAESEAQSAAWAQRWLYVHDSSSAEPDTLRAEARRVLDEHGETLEVTCEVGSSPFVLGVDYLPGDLVGVDLPGLGLVVKPVREVEETWSAGGHTVKPVIGDYAATAQTGAAFTTRQLVRTVESLKVRA